MNHVLIELGINHENSASNSGELSTEAKELVDKYAKETIFVSRLFTRFLSGWHPKNLLKIAIVIVNPSKREEIIPPNRFTKACAIYKHFEWNSYDKEENQISRYKILLDFMLKALTEASKKFDWPIEVFTAAYYNVIASNFVNEYDLLAPKSSPDKKHSASLSVQVAQNYSTIFLEVKNSDGKIQKREVTKVAQHKDDFSITESIKWIDNEELIISNKENEINFKYSLVNQAMEILFTPNVHDERYLQDELKLLNPNTSKTESLEILQRRIDEIKGRSTR